MPGNWQVQVELTVSFGGVQGNAFRWGRIRDITEVKDFPRASIAFRNAAPAVKLQVAFVATMRNRCYTASLKVAPAVEFIISGETARIGYTDAKFSLTPV